MHEINLIKPRPKTMFDIMITAVCPAFGPLDQQYKSVLGWQVAAATYVFGGPLSFPKDSLGLYQKPSQDCPTARSMLSQVMVERPGHNAIAICAPLTAFNGNPKAIIDASVNNGLDRAWAGRFGSPIPSFLVFSSSVLAQFLMEMPQIPFSSPSWAQWLDEWLKLHLQEHRYIDLAPFDFVVPSEPLTSTEPVQPQKKGIFNFLK